MRPDTTVHGLRSCFRDWASEQTAFPHDVCEMSLAHATGNAVEAAYKRTDLFDKRRALMDAWAKFCGTTGPAKGRNVCRDARRSKMSKRKHDDTDANNDWVVWQFRRHIQHAVDMGDTHIDPFLLRWAQTLDLILKRAERTRQGRPSKSPRERMRIDSAIVETKRRKAKIIEDESIAWAGRAAAGERAAADVAKASKIPVSVLLAGIRRKNVRKNS